MKHLNVCKQTDTCRHVHVNRHLRFSPLLAATNVTTCDYHVSCRNFAVGLPSLKKAPIKKKCQKGTPPFRNQQHNVCVCQQSSTPGKVQTQTLGARVSKHLLTLQKVEICSIHRFLRNTLPRKTQLAAAQLLSGGNSYRTRVSRCLLTLAETNNVKFIVGVCVPKLWKFELSKNLS
jgi:hypothetical protein